MVMPVIREYLSFLRPSVQRDVVKVAVGCKEHPAYRGMRQPRRTTTPKRSGRCCICVMVYAAKQRVRWVLE